MFKRFIHIPKRTTADQFTISTMICSLLSWRQFILETVNDTLNPAIQFSTQTSSNNAYRIIIKSLERILNAKMRQDRNRWRP